MMKNVGPRDFSPEQETPGRRAPEASQIEVSSRDPAKNRDWNSKLKRFWIFGKSKSRQAPE